MKIDMMELTVPAYAKLNITLDVLSKMDNGYHNLKMIMQSVSLYDDVQIRAKQGNGAICLTVNRSYLPTDERNIVWKAAEAFCKYCSITNWNLAIKLQKRIPVCAGLGGGSSDAAATLRGLNQLFETRLSVKELEQIGAEIGSDVPYCISGGTVLAEGRGEILTNLQALPYCSIVICKPPFPISTPELYAKIDNVRIKHHPNTDGVIAALKQRDLHGVTQRVYNVFEDVLPAKSADEINHIKNCLYDGGACGAAMSGTGSAVFGIFTDAERAAETYYILSGKYRDTFLTEPIDKLKI